MSKISFLQLHFLRPVFPKLKGSSPLVFNLERGKVKTSLPEGFRLHEGINSQKENCSQMKQNR